MERKVSSLPGHVPPPLRLASNHSELLFSGQGKLISFVNFSSIAQVLGNTEYLERFSFYCDGILCSKFFSFFSRNPIRRVSFDFSSIARDVFEYASRNGKSIYFIGGTAAEVDRFVAKIRLRYPDLKISGHRDGYWDGNLLFEVLEKTISASPDIVVAGLGAGKQEQFLSLLQDQGFFGTGFTCGGFIRQESTCESDYYPSIINRLNLRAFYRMVREPHTIKRYLTDYPFNLFKTYRLLSRGRVSIEVKTWE
ncbi:N-acetylglucosaminyldiphosphoundecaprenol N-acetyl-beta-D-mannosaminyltransferase [Halopseudomonas xinjiangensis]|uniref:N-acetylglucosaminyldiphosphoundecaprenol N-acetyl-beta-D-mannosaminyltransferase n=1 Tax=Halopseudomonas xinjiangensis TaxID=487184 RepID=A0A1H1NLK7_9GAMM|nr:WecB/TagA/CpsF family glycosyltransferase [Halopseudomonas xinjiangensis]SDR99595.1 N-acetylglucosaminyldiphosphoundecaprenol N-acetyl-beta-D-mannosaminyltransferase [Halopseudomonas xinjiangensis]